MTKEVMHQIEFLMSKQVSTQIASTDKNGTPHASYAPYIFINSKFYILVSRAAKHYHNLMTNPTASLMIIEDESRTSSIFFRKRITIEASCVLTKDSAVSDEFILKHGSMVSTLLGMDFGIFECSIIKGQIVYGPGKAFMLDEKLNYMSQIQKDHDLIIKEFTFDNKRYCIVKLENIDTFIDQYSSEYEIEDVYDKDRLIHIKKHFQDDFDFTGDFSNHKIMILTNK